MSHRPAQVKNKNPANIQITAEQILREATERQERIKPPPAQLLADKDELDDYRFRKRKGFEDWIRANRTHISSWLKYAQWEGQQNEHERARSIFERSLQIDPRNNTLWLRYVETEMKLKNVNHARNVFDRAVAILPRIYSFWYKYTYMEEMLDNIAGARQIFERWMLWEPKDEAWMAFVKFEQRYKETERARSIFQRFVNVHPHPKNWIKWSKFEEQLGDIDKARMIYEQCNETLGEHFMDQNIFVSFAKFEIRLKETERARCIYKFALEKLPKGKSENVYNAYTLFEKQFGGREGIEDVVTTKRRTKYEAELASNSRNYDVWFDYARLEEAAGDFTLVREVYERALAQVPLIAEKRYWRRYVYIWLFYAIWEESVAKVWNNSHLPGSGTRRSSIYPVPQSHPTSEIYFCKNLARARKTLGVSIGQCPKPKLFTGYVELELKLREFDRARTLYEKFLMFTPTNCHAWIKYTELEVGLGDIERARGIFEIAVQQTDLDMPEILWKAYIDFEIKEIENTRARALYERLLERTEHVKVWISLATFERSINKIDAARIVYERAESSLKRRDAKEQRSILLDAWEEVEKTYGDAEHISKVSARKPKVVKKRRMGDAGQWEEYFDYIFPDDASDRPNFKLLAMAHDWKSKMDAGEKNGDDSSSEEEDE